MTPTRTFGSLGFKSVIVLIGLALLAACGGGSAPPAGGGDTSGSAGNGGSGGSAATPTAATDLVPDDIPIVEGAPFERVSEGTLEYRVPQPIQDVVDYYQAELVAQGWEETGRPNIFGALATLRYSKQVEGKTRSLSVSLQYNENAQTTLVRLFWQGY